MENNDQNPATSDAQPAEKPCCSAAPKGRNSWKTVILLVILLLAGAVTARSILKNGSASTCGSGGCPIEATCSKVQTPAACSADKPACSQGQAPATCAADTKNAPDSTSNAVPGCCPAMTSQDILPTTCPKQAQ